MALLANISFQDGPAGKTPVPRNQWFPTEQRRRYGSNRGKTMIQGTRITSGGLVGGIAAAASEPRDWPPLRHVWPTFAPAALAWRVPRSLLQRWLGVSANCRERAGT